MYEIRNLDELIVLFPLDEEIKTYLVSLFTLMKDGMNHIVEKNYNIKLPDKGNCEIIQLFFYNSMGLAELFEKNQKCKFGLEIITKYMEEQTNLFRNYLKEIALKSYNRGIIKEHIESYIVYYFEYAFKAVFPEGESILNEIYKDSL